MSAAKMNPEIKARWVAALRSGEYEQATGQLRNEHGEFCCLGVLCDLLQPSDWNRPDVHGGWQHLGEYELPSAGVFHAVDLPGTPKVEIDGRVATLDEHNDGVKAGDIPARTFAEIADAIEAQL